MCRHFTPAFAPAPPSTRAPLERNRNLRYRRLHEEMMHSTGCWLLADAPHSQSLHVHWHGASASKPLYPRNSNRRLSNDGIFGHSLVQCRRHMHCSVVRCCCVLAGIANVTLLLHGLASVCVCVRSLKINSGANCQKDAISLSLLECGCGQIAAVATCFAHASFIWHSSMLKTHTLTHPHWQLFSFSSHSPLSTKNRRNFQLTRGSMYRKELVAFAYVRKQNGKTRNTQHHMQQPSCAPTTKTRTKN